MDIKKTLKNSKLVSAAYYSAKSLKLESALKKSELDAKALQSHTHHELYCTKIHGLEKYNRYAELIHNTALKEISKKTKIKVGFVVYSSAMWSCDKLYRFFENDSCFEPYLIVGMLKSGMKATETQVYKEALSFFDKKGYKTVAAGDKPEGKLADFGNPDILIYLTPYTTAFIPGCFDIAKIPLDKLCVYIPYSIIVSGTQKLFANGTINLAWKSFCESRSYFELMQSQAELGGKNAVYSGFPGLDSLLEGQDKGLFKGKEGNKKIIYAPHFSVGDSGIGFSTFEKNHRFMLELAEKTSDSVSWVIKPHPRLKSESVRCGIFKSEKDFDEYISKWDSLPNARSMFGGEYNNLFKESDAIILDSASFLVEYQFTGNPILFLTNERQNFNAFGQSVLNTVYKADGSDFEAIESFIKETVINQNDSMRQLRKAFFEKELNYIEHNGGLTASEKIFTVIRSEIKNENNNS